MGARFVELLRLTALIVLSWIAAALFFATQNHLVESVRNRPDDLERQILEMLVVATAAAILTPFLLYVAEHFPLRRPVSKRNLAVTIAAVVAFAILRSAMDLAFARLMYDDLTLDIYRAVFLAVFHVHILLGGLVIVIATLAALRRELAQRQQREARAESALAQVTLHQLRADLHPHFLFNTLNAVAALLHSDPPAAERTISSLSELLRRSFSVTERVEIPLGEELEFLERYLELQKTRFGERLSTRIQVDDDELLRAAVPPMLLQPLVENAILHGVTKRAAGGIVEVHVRATGDRMHIEVRDDGPGTDASTIFERGNIGIRNTAARLASLYRERQSLTFRNEGSWFVAAVDIPLAWTAAERIAS